MLAVGEAFNASGRDLITAAALAYEIQCRLCDAASLRKHGVAVLCSTPSQMLGRSKP